MTVRRVVANLSVSDPQAARDFYAGIFGLRDLMDHGWIVTLGTGADRPVQLSLAREGGSGTPVPALSVEVDDIDAVLLRAGIAGAEIAYPLTREPWGVRRFFFRDPWGNLINVLSHGD